MPVEPAARGIERGSDRDEHIVMRLERASAAADGDGLAGEGQLDAKMRHPPRPLRTMSALDDHPAPGKSVEDALQVLGALANLGFDRRR